MNATVETLHDPRSTDAIRILLVEDDEHQRQFAERALQRLPGIALASASTGQQAIDRLSDGDWDLLLCDIGLPDVSGLELARAFRRAQPWVRVVMMTADPSVGRAVEALQGGFDDFVVKPAAATELLPRVQIHGNRGRALRLARPRVLAIGAHPDDVEIGCGGVLALHAERSDRVSIFTLSRGARGGQEHVRALEAQRSARRLGARLFLGGFEDTRFGDEAEVIRAIEEVVDSVRPNIVYTHSAHDRHQDHRAVHLATLVATRRVPRVYAYQSPSSTPEFRPSRFTDVTRVMARKQAMLSEFRTQQSKCAYLQPDFVEATARYWGRYADYALVEALEVLRDHETGHGTDLGRAHVPLDIAV